ncbi:MAG TPA: DUF4198 domain-containing protein [Stenotrophomonas sp.]|jgi:uncharacterized GH25 family protein
MKPVLLGCLLLSSLSLSAQAHEIWIERDASGPVRVNFGEPAQEVADPTEDELHRLKDFDLFDAKGKAGKATRQGDHLVASLAGTGDAWLFDGDVFEPWEGESGFESVTYYARAGRQSTTGRLGLELVPVKAGGDTLTVLFRDKPLADAEITVIDPQKWSKTLKSDAQGRITLPALRSGRHIVVVSHKEPVKQQIAGKQVAVMHHISTLTFANE